MRAAVIRLKKRPCLPSIMRPSTLSTSHQFTKSFCSSSSQEPNNLTVIGYSLHPDMGFMKRAHATLQLSVTLPKLSPNFDVEEFMEGAEAAFHAFNQSFNNAEWGTMQAIASDKLAGVSREVGAR